MTDLPPLPPRTPPDDPSAGGEKGDDTLAWGQAIKDVRQLPPSDKRMTPTKTAPPKSSREASQSAVLEAKLPRKGASPVPPNPGFDRRSAQKLREGRMEIEGRIDLHGMTLAQAHSAVSAFIHRMAAAEKRCLIVITGKGQREIPGDKPWYEQPRGQIRQALPVWLGDPDLSRFILSTSPARPEHGGAGAIYVLLRRNRG